MLSANLELLVEDCEAFHLLTALPVALLARLAPKVADLDLAASAASFAVDQLLYRAQEEDTSAHPTALDILATCQAYDLGALTPQGHESLFDLVDVAARKLSAAGRPGPAAAELGAKLGALVQFELLSDDAIERALQTPLLPAANIVRSLLRGRRQSNFEGEQGSERADQSSEGNQDAIREDWQARAGEQALRAKGGPRTPARAQLVQRRDSTSTERRLAPSWRCVSSSQARAPEVVDFELDHWCIREGLIL